MKTDKKDVVLLALYGEYCRDDGCFDRVTAATLEISVTSGHKFIEIVEVDSADKPLAYTITKLNAG